MPYAAGTCDKPEVILVQLRCRDCGHEWAAEAPKVPLSSFAVWPRRDRRRSPQRGNLR
jgi:hypothetical protein